MHLHLIKHKGGHKVKYYVIYSINNEMRVFLPV